MKKKFLLWWLARYGYAFKRREFIGIGVMAVIAALLFWLMVGNAWIGLGLVLGALVVILLCPFIVYPKPWDEIEAHIFEETMEQERKRIEDEYGH